MTIRKEMNLYILTRLKPRKLLKNLKKEFSPPIKAPQQSSGPRVTTKEWHHEVGGKL